MDAMTKRPTFKESWLTGEIPHHPTLGSALLNAVLRAREVLTGQQEKTVHARWDTLHTVLGYPSLSTVRAGSLGRRQAAYLLSCRNTWRLWFASAWPLACGSGT